MVKITAEYDPELTCWFVVKWIKNATGWMGESLHKYLSEQEAKDLVVVEQHELAYGA